MSDFCFWDQNPSLANKIVTHLGLKSLVPLRARRGK